MLLRVLRAGKRLLDIKLFLQSLAVVRMIYLRRTTKYPPEVLDLEKKFSDYIGVRHGLSFCNGTSACDAAIFGLNLPKGSEAIISGVSFHSIVMSILHNGFDIKYADVDRNLSIVLDDDLVSEHTRLLVVSHLFGYPQDMDAVMAFAERHDLRVIEDCSHAHGASHKGKKVGSFGDVSFFSLQGDKAVAAGEGGIALTDDKDCFDRMRLYMHLGRDMRDVEVVAVKDLGFFTKIGFGKKGRMHPFAAALSLVDLRFLDARNANLSAQLDALEDIISDFDFIAPLARAQDLVLGGFHYGIPLWVDLPEQMIADKFFGDKKIRFERYPYVEYERYGFFRSSARFDDLLRSRERVGAGNYNSNLDGVNEARGKLVFLSLGFVSTGAKGAAALSRFLKTVKHEA